ncbi:hypothetical protein L227DRAFT_617807 [Lentinus tigrinus ALCF2SS1-6]|uniref:RING-type domain-containing protein n=1 Tax=Lentinus tigrinus ALCF2SS1-6 TaxID=1328759 RepID=A0A5C2RMB0_9APHY|nr:hypothetical protein L227DRAFT_617807 [Lentinus tigrinus ALCF2SS1-6]
MHSLKIPNPEDDPDNETLEHAAATSGLSGTGALRYRLVLYEINNRRLHENEETLAAEIAVLEKDKTDLEARMHTAEDKLQAINTEMTCPVCWSSPITHLWPCGHGLCRECKVLNKEAQDVTHEEEDLNIWFNCYNEQYHCPVCRRCCNQEYPLGNLHLLKKVTEILTPDV